MGLAVLGPLVREGYVLLLDAPAGPNLQWPTFFPLPSEGLVSVSAPFATVVKLVGFISPELPNKALVLGSIVVAGYGLFRFGVRTLGANPLAAAAGGTLYAVNPFVHDRLLAGQLYLTFGYALLPWALPALTALVRDGRGTDTFRVVVWTAVVSLVDVHAGAILMVLGLAALACSPRPWRTRLGYSAGMVLGLVGVHMFWILPSILGAESARLGAGDLAAYAPRPRSSAVLSRVLLLHGFWRNEFATPLERSPLLFLGSFVPIAATSAGGFLAAMQSDRWRRPAGAIGLCSLVALILGMGTSFAPTAPLTRLLYDYMPGYGIFREPQKWIAMVALFYSIFLVIGVDRLTLPTWRGVVTWAAPVLAIVLSLAGSWIMFWGFADRVHTSEFPSDWAAAAEEMEGEGNLLFLPWNLYQPLPFADNRIIASPARHYFGTSTFVSDDPALGRAGTTQTADPRSDYIARLVNRPSQLRYFGHLVAPLGVRYIALAHVADAPLYDFLNRQDDLRVTFSDSDMTLYVNDAWSGEKYPLRNEAGTDSLANVISDPVQQLASSTSLQAPDDPLERPTLPGAGLLNGPVFGNDFGPLNGQLVGTERLCTDGWQADHIVGVCHLGVVAAFPVRDDDVYLWRPELWTQVVGLLLSICVVIGGLIGTLRHRSRRGVKGTN